ncbi:MAG: hypothetical protein J6K55_16950 [Clostridia bacterium]|nr:hypothetical protein [Clostridia bacterium]
MFYHASSTKDISILEPRISNHNTPLIYFSKKRENVLVYLSNAVEKYCKDTCFPYDGIWKKWASYGFDKNGLLYIEEYYPNALETTYKGVSGYIYSALGIEESSFDLQIPYGATSISPVKVTGVEYIPDAYLSIMEAENKGLIKVIRYEELSEGTLKWLNKTIRKEYEQFSDHPEYRHFLRGNFPDLFEE